MYSYYDILYDSLAANTGDSTKNCAYAGPYRCTGTVPAIIFNDSTNKISYFSYYLYGSYNGNTTKFYVKKYGFYKIHNYATGGGVTNISDYILKGCKVNGVIYGDTSLTAVNNISSETPTSYSLSQNYPNPFNPTTKISFALPKQGLVTIKVFDVLGKEIETLVNESLKPGTYGSCIRRLELSERCLFLQALCGWVYGDKKNGNDKIGIIVLILRQDN